MNDRYLFRGKDVESGEWVKGAYGMGDDIIYRWHIADDDPNAAKLYLHEIDPISLGQCTGLRDKNGSLIFEGDIVIPVINEDNYRNRKIVVWNHQKLLYSFYHERVPSTVQAYHEHWGGVEIIGNIHDNPELLS